MIHVQYVCLSTINITMLTLIATYTVVVREVADLYP